MKHHHSVHEPDEELLSADDAIADADRLEALFEAREKNVHEASDEPALPLSVLLNAIDHLAPDALQEVARRATERLTLIERT